MTHSNPMDAMLAYWKDAWSRVGGGEGAAPTGGSRGASEASDPLGWMPSPEAVRRMQSAFLDAMAASADQYLRSPQFLESMKRSMDAAVQMRRQMEEHLRKNMAEAMHTPSQAGAETIAALHELEARIAARLDEIAARLERLERAGARPSDEVGKPSSGGAPRPRRSTGRRPS